jgi:hypothetical protein
VSTDVQDKDLELERLLVIGIEHKLTCMVVGVNDGQTPMLVVVKALGEYLTSTEDETRLKGRPFWSNSLCYIDFTQD